jgi:hypothetical protein
LPCGIVAYEEVKALIVLESDTHVIAVVGQLEIEDVHDELPVYLRLLACGLLFANLQLTLKPGFAWNFEAGSAL